MTAEYELKCVMDIIDKFLEGEELNLDVIQRATLMTERLSQKIDSLEKENVKLNEKCKRAYKKGFKEGSAQPNITELMPSWGCNGRSLYQF